MVHFRSFVYAAASIIALLNIATASPVASPNAMPGDVQPDEDGGPILVTAPNLGATRVFKYNGGFVDSSNFNNLEEPGWEKKTLYYIYGINNWSREGNNATVASLYGNLAKRMNTLGKHMLQFSWGIEEHDMAFALVFTYDLPSSKKHGKQLERAIMDVGGPSVDVEWGWPMWGQDLWLYRDYSVRFLADIRPRPFRFHYNRWVDLMSGPLAPVTIDDLYLGRFCLGTDGMGTGCPNECAPPVLAAENVFHPAPPCAPM